MKLTDNKGLTLIELVGALVIFGLLFGISAMALTMYIQTSRRTIMMQQIQTEGALLAATIEQRMNNFTPTDAETCEGDDPCIILVKQFEATVNGSVTWTTLDPVETMTIIIAEGLIQVDDVTINPSDRLLDETSQIRFELKNNGDIVVTIELVYLLDNGEPIFFLSTTRFPRITSIT